MTKERLLKTTVCVVGIISITILFVSFTFIQWQACQSAQEQWKIRQAQYEQLEEQVNHLTEIQERVAYSQLQLQYLQQLIYHYPSTMQLTRTLQDLVEKQPQASLTQGESIEHVFEEWSIEEIRYELNMPVALSQGWMMIKRALEAEKVIHIHEVALRFPNGSGNQMQANEQVMLKMVFSVFNKGGSL